MARTLEKDIDLGLEHDGVLMFNPQGRDFTIAIRAQDPDGKPGEMWMRETLTGPAAETLIGQARAWVADLLEGEWTPMVEVYINHRLDWAVEMRVHEFEMLRTGEGYFRRVDGTDRVRKFSPSASAIQFYNKTTGEWTFPLVDARTHDTRIILHAGDPRCAEIEMLELKLKHFVDVAVTKLTQEVEIEN